MSNEKRIKLCLEFLENPVFRVGFEFTPEYRAPRVIPITATTPLPTTIIGAMFSVLLTKKEKPEKTLAEILNEIESDIKIKFDDKGFIEDVSFPIYDKLQEIIFGTSNAISDLYGPYWISPEKEIYFPTTIHSMNDALIKLKNGQIEKDKVYIPKKHTVIGIALDPKTKTVKTGHTYTLEKLLFKNWQLCIELTIKKNKEAILNQINGAIVRIGTKGALAKIEINEKDLITPKKEASEWILISPAIITKNIGKIIKKAKIQPIPLGYSLLKQKKRPSIPMLATGSIIKNANYDSQKDNEEKLTPTIRSIRNKKLITINKYGFGSLYPYT